MAERNAAAFNISSDTVGNPISSHSSEVSRHPPLPNRQFEKQQAHANKMSAIYRAMACMVSQAAENGDKHVISMCVEQCSRFFSGKIMATLRKGSRLVEVKGGSDIVEPATE